MFKIPNTILFSTLSIFLILSLFLNISFGQVSIPFKEVFTTIFTGNSNKETWHYIILNFRLPKALTAILVGTGLSICGLLMQTLFRNPMAGPYVLGLSSGSSLGVALLILGSNILGFSIDQLGFSIILASSLGSFIVLLLILLVSNKLKDTMSILIVGLMFSSFTSAIVSVLSYFSSAEELQKFTFWTMGNIANISWQNIIYLTIAVSIGLILSVISIKPLDGLLLGENYAKSLGINIKKTRLLVIFATSILAGSITAFAGPIAFIGLAVPHLAKLLFQTSNHKILLLATLLIGAIIMLFCDTVSQMPGFEFTLPINAVTSLIGAPVVIWLIVRKRSLT